MNQINWVPFENRFLKNYQEFTKNNYGLNAYQCKENYIKWLYQENPLSKEKNDFLIGINSDNENIVGCIHKMQMEWVLNKETFRVPALHNLVVDSEYRHGIGFMLVMAAVSGEEQALMPGVENPFSSFYKTLKYQKINAFWYRKFLKPTSSGIFLLANKFLKVSAKENYFDSLNAKKINNNFIVDFSPSKDIMQQIAASLNNHDSQTFAPLWTGEQVKWRFFHPFGPQHILVYENFNESLENFALVSMGPRRGLNIARILSLKSSSNESLDALLTNVFNIVKNEGGHLIQFFSADSLINRSLISIGWNPVKHSPDTYIYHKNKSDTFENYAFTGSAGDFGFEAIK